MTEMQILFQGKEDAPKLAFIPQPVVDMSANPKIIFCVCEGGMASGEPSVLIASPSPMGTVVMQTSLDKLITAALAVQEGCKLRWGWVQPVGFATIAPPDRDTRKKLLLQIRQELEEWDEVEDEVDKG